MGVEQSTIVIIGGSSGIGLATASRAVRLGARVIIGGRDEGRLHKAAKASDAQLTLQVDGADGASLDSFYKTIGPFDHLVIAASGGRGAGAIGPMIEADLRDGFERKFWVHWRAARAALPYISNGGSITFVSAASARVGNPGTSGLAAINGAINAMVAPLARELAPVRVNAVSPGVVDTPWWDNQPPGIKSSFFDAAAKSLPVGRVGAPEDLAEAILFLAGNGFTTGIILDVDGGLRTANPA